MPYVRISIQKPTRGNEARVEELMRKLEGMIASQPGCTASFLLKPHDDSGEIARIAIYEDEDAAEAAANVQNIMAIRSEIHLITEPGHIERAFFSI